MQLLHVLNQFEFAKVFTMHGWILTMFFAELIRKDRSLIKTEIQNYKTKTTKTSKNMIITAIQIIFAYTWNAFWNAMVVYMILLMAILVIYTNGWFFQYISNEGKLISLYQFDIIKKLNSQLINKCEELYD